MSFQEVLRPLLQKAWDNHYVNKAVCTKCGIEKPASQGYDGICLACIEENEDD